MTRAQLEKRLVVLEEAQRGQWRKLLEGLVSWRERQPEMLLLRATSFNVARVITGDFEGATEESWGLSRIPGMTELLETWGKSDLNTGPTEVSIWVNPIHSAETQFRAKGVLPTGPLPPLPTLEQIEQDGGGFKTAVDLLEQHTHLLSNPEEARLFCAWWSLDFREHLELYRLQKAL